MGKEPCLLCLLQVLHWKDVFLERPAWVHPCTSICGGCQQTFNYKTGKNDWTPLCTYHWVSPLSVSVQTRGPQHKTQEQVTRLKNPISKSLLLCPLPSLCIFVWIIYLLTSLVRKLSKKNSQASTPGTIDEDINLFLIIVYSLPVSMCQPWSSFLLGEHHSD